MKFVDEATIRVEAGKGGNGCLSFRREKFIPLGGPDGGDGGDGGSIYLLATESVNTLVDFRYQRIFTAKSGSPGEGGQRRGKSGEDLVIPVPIGTVIHEANTGELIGDLLQKGQKLCVAQGGFHGLGNARYKSSVNRAPRQTTQGSLGEARDLKLELKLLADIGLLGLPNAGKSTLISAVSNARPKIADYPFTTLHPNLGVVSLAPGQSFVMADIPGLIPGASEGAGLGLQFLKHLTRTSLLLHVVDIADEVHDPSQAVRAIETELKKYSEELAGRPRWLIFNKIDALTEQEADQRCQDVVKALNWHHPFFKISAVSHAGTLKLCYQLMEFVTKEKVG